MMNKEKLRLLEANETSNNWKFFGPYVSDRQWGTVREDYSEHGNAWEFLPHDWARSKAYRWGEDGLAGFSDDKQFLNLSLALWNGKDPILKERLFGLTGNEGNHGEDCKEIYFYLDATPTHSYNKMLYKYPINETLSNLEKLLNPKTFFRLNRSEIVNLDFIENLKPDFHDRLEVSLRNLKIKLVSSINRTPDLRKWLESQ
ncbi:MAG: LytTR family transcriptional regulator [Pyrinomonadaceae bacterium]|nr:LytTR family transcriptional regulator [Pyrinomonadaceae bacterium]